MADALWFGKYRLVRRLAEGGMAEIYYAKQSGPEGFEKGVVIKRVLPHLSERSEFVQMFLDEARISALLSHPNIVQVFDFGQIEGMYFLAMEYLVGEDLRSIFATTRSKGEQVPVQIAANIVAAACDGLHHAHTATDSEGRPLGIVHRDVSPSNLLVTYHGMVKVLDFGIAKAAGKLLETKTGTIKGKLMYMSPEQAEGHPLDGRSDVFALGVVLYELITGTRLFARDSDAATLRALLMEPIVPPSQKRPGLPSELDATVMRALERDRERRYPSAADFRRDLDDFLSQHSYVPAATQLRDYLVSLFGTEHVVERSHLPASDPMMVRTGASATATVSAPGSEAKSDATVSGPRRMLSSGATPSAPRPAAALSSASASAAPAPAPVQAPSSQSAPWRGVALVAVVVMAGCVGALVFALRRAPQVEPASRPSEAPALSPPTAAPAPPKPALPAPALAAATVPPPIAAPLAPSPSPEAARADEHRSRHRAKREQPVASAEPKLNGKLSVNCTPWCRIFLDDRDTGLNSPALGISLPAGRHRLVVRNPPSGMEQVKDVVIAPNQETREVIRF